MPRISTIPQDVPEDELPQQEQEWLPKGNYACIVKQFTAPIDKGQYGWRYEVFFEEIKDPDRDKTIGRVCRWTIACDKNGVIPRTRKGEVRWGDLLVACNKDRTIEDYDTEDLLFRCVRVTLLHPPGYEYPFVHRVVAVDEDDEKLADKYVNKWYPQKF